MEQQQFSVSGYLPNGMKVFFTIPLTDANTAFIEASQFTNKLLADGLLLAAPGLEAGEEREQVGWIVRRNQKNDEGVTPIIDLYPTHEATKFKFLTVYLNNADDIAEFESAFGLKLASLPVLPGKKNIDRDEQGFEQYVVKVNATVNAVSKHNPKYNPEEQDITKRKPKRLFVRWDAQGAGIPTATPPVATTTPQTPENAPKSQPDAEVLPLWTNTPVGQCWSVLKAWLVSEKIYENDFELKNSFIKRGISDGKTIADEWKHKPARELIAFVKARHAEVDIDFMGEQKASGQ